MRMIKIIIAGLMSCSAALVLARADEAFNSHFTDSSDGERVWQEQAVPLPSYPAADAQWVNMYINATYTGQPQLMLNSIFINKDNTVHYILNQKSKEGINNLTAEGMYCAKRSVKVYGYGDDDHKRWVQARQPKWTVINTTFNDLDPVRSVLYQTFCEDGLPSNQKELMERIRDRAMR